MKKQRGQNAVEFTLTLMLVLIIAWIPADFGLAFYTGQVMLNAAREGARLAAATKDLSTEIGASATCTVPCSSSDPAIMQDASKRARLSLIASPSLTMALQGGTGCDRLVTVTVSGDYNFFFYRLLNWFSLTSKKSQTLTRQASARWEHGC